MKNINLLTEYTLLPYIKEEFIPVIDLMFPELKQRGYSSGSRAVSFLNTLIKQYPMVAEYIDFDKLIHCNRISVNYYITFMRNEPITKFLEQ